MSIAVKPADRSAFEQAIVTRQSGQTGHTLANVATYLNDHYRNLDEPARKAFIDNAVRMYANYENRWLGEAVNGRWVDSQPQGTNNTYFTVPLLTAHVDTHTTFYTKTKPKYLAKPFIDTHLNRRVAEMCQRVGADELSRMLRPSILQHEAQNIALATVSYRQILMDYQPHSPVITQDKEEEREMEVPSYQCQDCSESFQGEPQLPGEEAGEVPQCQGEGCMSDNVTQTGVEPVTQTVTTKIQVPLPRPMLRVPNPIAVQDDFSAATFPDSRFVITRRKIPVKEAEFYYQIDLSSAYDNSGAEANAQYQQSRTPFGPQTTDGNWIPLNFPDYAENQNKHVEEVQMWLDPCEYGLLFADGDLLRNQYPSGLFLHVVGDQLVSKRACNKDIEWVRVQQGVRPASNKGMGMCHLADLNDAINNSVSLDYTVLRTHGFPLRLLRGKMLSQLPQANQTLVIDKITDDQKLSDAILTEQASNTSGLLGVLTNKFQGFMQAIGGALSTGMSSPDASDIMGSATAAASFQEMMADRMGLSVQMRVEADIDTIYAILTLLQQDKRNRQYFLDGGYDESVVDAFFTTDFRSMFYLEPAKGTDEPRMDSVNTFKVQSFAQLTASLTGLRQFDPEGFRDIVSALGETLNIDVSIGAGRKERNLADNRISRIIELYNSQKSLPDALNMDASTFGRMMYEAVTMKEKLWLQTVVQSQGTPPPLKPTAKDMALLQEEQQYIAETIELGLYDYDALAETYADWLQSNAGQNSDIAISAAVGLLYADCVKQQDKKKALAKQEAMAMQLGMMPPPNKDEPDKNGNTKTTKRDGSTGPGRPRDVHVDAAPE